MRGRRLFILSVISVLWLGHPGSARAGDAYDLGVAFYESGRYLDAVIQLSTAVESDAGDAHAHYYLANSLVRIKRYADAMSEYESCIALSPHSLYASYSRLAVQRFQKLAAEQSGRQFVEGAIPLVDTPPGYDEAGHARAALMAVSRQTEREKARLRAEGVGRVDALMAGIERQVRAIQLETGLATDEIRHARGRRMTAFHRQAIQDIDEESAARINSLRQAGQYMARKQMRAYVERARSLEDAAQGLLSQMSGRPGAGVRLQAAGTNLYVRNYDYVQPEALVARAGRLPVPVSAKR